jgi:hypothetical protein
MTPQSTPTRTASENIDALELACSRVTVSVGVIHAMVQLEDGNLKSNIGTVFCVDKRGYFLTALHVVKEALDSFIVVDSLSETCVVATDACNDLALIRVKTSTCEFDPVTFATALPEIGELVGGLGYPERGLAVELSSYLGRFYGQLVDGIGPNGKRLEGDTLQSALCFIGEGGPLGGYSCGPIVNEHGQVLATTMKADDELGFIIGPSAADMVAFVEKHLPVA